MSRAVDAWMTRCEGDGAAATYFPAALVVPSISRYEQRKPRPARPRSPISSTG